MTRTSKLLFSVSFAGLLSLFAACSGGGGGGDAGRAPDTSADVGSVVVAIDTSSGGEQYVQFTVGAATLEGPAGLQTRNLMTEPRQVTVCDPSGEVDGVRLRQVPAGDYVAVHLLVVPQSGVVLDENGDVAVAAGPIDVRIPLDGSPGGLRHDPSRTSWVVVGYDEAPLMQNGGSWAWTPQLSLRDAGDEVLFGRLSWPVGDGDVVRATAAHLDDAVVELVPEAGSEFVDEDGGVGADFATFRDALVPTDELTVLGALAPPDRIHVIRAYRTGRGNASRLIGRVQSSDAAAQTFVLRVQAVNRRSSGLELQTPADIVVNVADARIERPNGASLTFDALEPGRLAKVTWDERLVEPEGVDTYDATLVQLPRPGGAMRRPRWRGVVQSIDPVAQTLVLTPANPSGIVIDGQQVAELEVRVDDATEIVRQQPGGRVAIDLSEVLLDDVVRLRGVVEGPAVVRATSMVVHN